MDIGTIIWYGICIVIGLVAIYLLWLLWVYLSPPVLHLLIKLSSEQTKAIILEIKNAGQGFAERSYSGMQTNFDYSTFQPVRVKLEVHPINGTPYITHDRFTLHNSSYELKPGAEIQVAVSRLNPRWVASLLETARYNGEQSPKAELLKAKEMLRSGTITQQEYEKKVQEIFPSMSGISMSGPGISMSGPGISISGGQSNNDPKAELEKLKEMLNSGLITQQDYEKKKDEILSKM